MKEVSHVYSKKELYSIRRKVDKAEEKYLIALSNIEALAQYVQPFYEQEICVTPSTDGAMITDNNGELWTVRSTLGI